MSNDFNNITASDDNVASRDAIDIDGIAQIIDTGVTVANNRDSINNLGVNRTFDIISSQTKE